MANWIEKLDSLLKEPSFTAQEARDRGVSAKLLAYHIKQGHLVKLGRGIYRGLHAKEMDDFRWEDLAESLACVKNGVICLVSALALYELTDEIPRQHWIAISHATRHRANPSVKIVRMRNIDLGSTFIEISGIRMPIFDRERTIVDAFRYLSSEIAIKALRVAVTKRGREKIRLEALRKYAKALRVKIEPYLLALSV